MAKIIEEIRTALGDRRNQIACIIFFVFLYFLLYYAYRALTTTPEIINDVDSLRYHIPIAEGISKGKLFPPVHVASGRGTGYYPAVGEAILSLFILTGIPLGLYNVLSLILLATVGYLLARRVNLSPATAIIYSASISTLNSVLRLVHNQTIDIWLAVFYLSIVYILLAFKRESNYLKLGVASGLLIGVKYPGLIYLTPLLLVFYKPLLSKINLKNILYFLVPVAVLGLFWFIRNYGLTGNPVYPGNLFGFKGNPDFMPYYWIPFQTIFVTPGGIFIILQALISEYLAWSMLLFITTVYLIFFIKRKYIDDKTTKLAKLGLINFAIFTILPSRPGAAVSDVRYLFPSFMLLILVAFIYAKKFRLVSYLSTLALLQSVAVLAQIAFRPKLIFAWLVFLAVYLFKVDYRNKTT